MMYDFSKRFSIHWGAAAVVTDNDEFAWLSFDAEQLLVKRFEDEKYPVAVDRFSETALLNDGTAHNYYLTTGDLKDVIAVCSNQDILVGLTKEGGIISEYTYTDDNSYAEIRSWSDIVAIDAGDTQVVGLKSDGTVVAAGSEKEGQLNVDDWKDIVAVSAGQDFTCGLKADGTVVTTMPGEWVNEDLVRWNSGIPVVNWDHIIAISAGTGK